MIVWGSKGEVAVLEAEEHGKSALHRAGRGQQLRVQFTGADLDRQIQILRHAISYFDGSGGPILNQVDTLIDLFCLYAVEAAQGYAQVAQRFVDIGGSDGEFGQTVFVVGFERSVAVRSHCPRNIVNGSAVLWERATL